MTAIPIVEAASLTVNAVPLPPSRYRPNMGYALDSDRNMATAKLDPKTRPTKVWKAVCSFVFTLQRLHRKFKSVTKRKHTIQFKKVLVNGKSEGLLHQPYHTIMNILRTVFK